MVIMTDTLLNEFEYYLAHQDELLSEYAGMYIVIKGNAVIGSYSSALEAVEQTQKEHQLGTFLVQLVSPGDTDINQVFHTRVAFS